MKTPAPGIYRNVRDAEYHSWDAASVSRLKPLATKTPAHCKYLMAMSRDSAALRRGRFADMAIFSPEVFAKLKQLPEDFNKSRKADKDLYAVWSEEYGEQNLVRFDEMEQARAIREAVLANSKARALLELRSDTQLSVVWQDNKSGVLCKGRPDFICASLSILGDLKTTVDASESVFAKTIGDYGYHLQAKLYQEGLADNDLYLAHAVYIVAEAEAPHCVAVYELDKQSLMAADVQLRQMLAKWRECQESGIWPGYPEEVRVVGLPAWQINKINEKTVGGNNGISINGSTNEVIRDIDASFATDGE